MKRVVIIDFSPLAYRYAFGGATALSSTIMVDGVPRVVDTTIPAYTIKAIHRFCHGGIDPCVVCFDAMGANRSKKAYFAQYHQKVGIDTQTVQYKGSRGQQDSRFYEGVNITANLLKQGGVVCLKAEGYEADDLIKSAVDRAKQDWPGVPIDIITGDQDLVPLVDDQVSVFLTSKRTTWAEDKSIEKKNYFQITPSTYQEYMETLSEFKNLKVPYNTVLLKKLLRGKKADDIPGYPKFTPTKYNQLVGRLIEDGHDLSQLCRYDSPVRSVCYLGTDDVIPADRVEDVPRERKYLKFSEPPTITKLCQVLSGYVDDSVIDHVRYIYNGVNLNTYYTSVPDRFKRKPAVMSQPVLGYDAAKLQEVVSVVRINLPMF